MSIGSHSSATTPTLRAPDWLWRPLELFARVSQPYLSRLKLRQVLELVAKAMFYHFVSPDLCEDAPVPMKNASSIQHHAGHFDF